jgi:hypothetical protein
MTRQETIEMLWNKATKIEEEGEQRQGEYEEVLQQIDALEAEESSE